MKKILIINLKRIGDIISMGSLIASAKYKESNTSISVVVYKEFEAAAQILNGISNVYTIDRKEIESYFKNQIYSNAFSINKFFDDIGEFSSMKWDEVVNYSNDLTSTFLTSYITNLNSCDYKGIKLDQNKLVKYSSPWSIVLNDILSQKNVSPINMTDLYHRIFSVEQSRTRNIVRIDESYTQKAFSSFKGLRQKSNKMDPRLIGVQLKTSDPQKDIPFPVLIQTINSLNKSDSYIPVLLIAPDDVERNLALEINKKLGNNIAVLEADIFVIPSVVSNLDAIITPDTFIKHLADLQELPVLEVSVGTSPIFKQSTRYPLSLLLYSSIDECNSEDILISLNVLLKQHSDREVSSSMTLYRPFKDDLGINYRYVSGKYPLEMELSRLAGRNYLSKKLNGVFINNLFSQISTYGSAKDIIQLLNREKEVLINTSRELLSTIRLLLTLKNTNQLSNEFINHLDQLLNFCGSNHFVSLPVCIFRSVLESAATSSSTDNIKKIEQSLLQLKSDLQIVMENIQIIENETRRITPSKNFNPLI